jgi:hypothetical protein
MRAPPPVMKVKQETHQIRDLLKVVAIPRHQIYLIIYNLMKIVI